MTIGIRLAAGAGGLVIGAIAAERLNGAFAKLPVTDRSPAQRALRSVNQIAAEQGLTQAELLKAMVDHREAAARSNRSDERK
ncbi:hypothetical protein MKK63_19700 [Methylobacterium sp. J-088]|uniref:hypothetical protein n=1 Tax=Methylobacterium sp. J-088 TaxID=2836664 RepID=UPI001FB913BC|nr:hypothetical protein [Methylobacterium sp. J-088]MCJ2064915.1 hypothetical protein [Methylobacterium sp. J-088]